MDALIFLFSVMLLFGIGFLLWMNTKAGKKWLANLWQQSEKICLSLQKTEQNAKLLVWKSSRILPSCWCGKVQRKLSPDKIFKGEGIDECIVRSVSLFSDSNDAKRLLKLPKFRKANIAEVCLSEKDGNIKKTFGHSHYSWWRSALFDVSQAKIISIWFFGVWVYKFVVVLTIK